MKKALALWLVTLVSLFFLSACGGGGSGGGPGTTANNPGESPDVFSDTIDGNAGRITVNFGPQQQTHRSLVDSTGWLRNGARLVVRKTEVVETWRDVTEEVCDEVDCWWVPVLDENDNPVRELVSSVETDTFKEVSDGPLDGTDPITGEPNGSGSVSIAVPPGTGYTLEVLTYFSDQATGLNFMLEYSKNDDGTEDKNPVTFEVSPGQTATVFISLQSDLAKLGLPAVPILAESEYEVTVASKSEALRNSWNVRQSLDEAALEAQWFIDDGDDVGADISTYSGTGPITLKAPYKNEPGTTGTTWKIWHHGQFFISDYLLDEGEDWQNWTFGTSDAGELNPWGGVDIEFN